MDRFILGLTGAPGAGTSDLARELARRGATVINVDELAHELLEEGLLSDKLVEAFGGSILKADDSIDRGELDRIAFRTPEAAAALNAIMHLPLRDRTISKLLRADGLVVIDCALLHEIGLNAFCDRTAYIDAPRELRLSRVARRGWDEAELERREKALGSAESRRTLCHFTIENVHGAATRARDVMLYLGFA